VAMAAVALDESVTIGVSAYGNVANTTSCLQAILASARGDFELLLVDDCTPDGGEIVRLFLEVARVHRNTRVFRFPRNLEYSGSLNCILSHARGESVLFVSNDIFVTPPYIEAVLAVASAEPRIGIVRGVSNFVDNGKPTHNLAMPGEIRGYEDVLAFATSLHVQHGHRFFLENFLTGDAFLTKRSLINAIGTFDPMFYGYFADHDYGVRCLRAGFELAVAEGAFAFHNQGSNFGYLDEAQRAAKLERRWARVHENWARFKLKYGLSIEQLYPGMNEIDWNHLGRAESATAHVPAADYAAFEVTAR